MKTFLKNLIKDVFRIFIIFFTIFIWVRYNSNDLKYSIILTSLLTLFVELILKLIAKKRGAKENLKTSERKKMEDIMTTFAFKSTDYAVNFFHNMLSQKHACLKRKQFVLIESENKEKIAIFPMFSFKEITPDEIVQARLSLKNLSVSKTIICTLSAQGFAKQIAKSQNVLLLEKEDTFVKFLKEYNYYPPENELITLQKEDGLNFKTIMKNALSPKRARLYFISALALGFSSLFVPYNIYYLSFASLMFLLCLITLIQPFFKKKLPDKII